MSRATVSELVRTKRRFAVTCHVRPDADALGSALGWAAMLRELGKETLCYCEDGVPANLLFLEGSETVVSSWPKDFVADATFIMDAAAKELVPGLPADRVGVVVVVDHHAAHDGFGDVVVREVDASATGEVVVRLFRELSTAPIPRGAAQPIYAAIVADTGGFRYPGTQPPTMKLGAELLEAGVDPWFVASHLFERWSPARMLLLGEVLTATEVLADGKLTLVSVDRDMLERVGASDEMLEGMVNYGRMLEGVEVAALLWVPRGKAGTDVKLSLRSGGDFDVSKLAVELGGGGHRTAAGASMKGTLTAAREAVIDAAHRLLGSRDSLIPRPPGARGSRV